MNKPKHILVAVDFSQYTDIAISRALELAEKTKAKITLLHIAKKNFTQNALTKVVPAIKKILVTPENYALSAIKKIVQRYSVAEGINIHYAILSGDHPARKILKYAKDNRNDFLILGAHGKYSIHDWFIGTTAEYIARKTHIPVLVIKKISTKSYKKILVPIDFSKPSKNALEFAYTLFPKSNLKILHVGDFDYEEILKNQKDISENKIDTMRKSLILFLSQKIKDFANSIGRPVSKFPTVIKFGYPSIEIVNEAKKTKQDLVIMGTEGHSEKHYLYIGRTAGRVLIEIDRDIILVPSSKKLKK